MRAVADGEPALHRSWYRMAIAHARLGNFEAAQAALRAAERLDPTLSFASSPARVQALWSQIQGGLAGAGPAAAAAQPALEVDEPLPAEVPSSAVTTASLRAAEGEAPVTSPVAHEMSQAVNTGVPDLVRAPAPLLPSAPTAAEPAVLPAPVAVDAQLPSWVVVGLGMLLVLAGAACVAIALEKGHAVLQHWRKRHKAKRPLGELLLQLRDDVALARRRLEMANSADSAVYAMLTRTLPVLELEAGRAARATVPAGHVLPGLAHSLEPAPAKVGGDERSLLSRGLSNAIDGLPFK